MTRPFFSRERISHFDIFDRHAEEAISQMRERLKEGFPVDFQVFFFSFLLVLCYFLIIFVVACV
jgi:hypothetical protein